MWNNHYIIKKNHNKLTTNNITFKKKTQRTWEFFCFLSFNNNGSFKYIIKRKLCMVYFSFTFDVWHQMRKYI